MWIHGKRMLPIIQTFKLSRLLTEGLRSGFGEEHPLVRMALIMSVIRVLTSASSSAIIEDLEHVCDAEPNSTLAYFYCDFRDPAKQNIRGLLSSLLLQLSLRLDPDGSALSTLYTAHDHGSRQPTEDTLRKAVKGMLELSHQGPVYIVIDAVDECPNSTPIPDHRAEILNLIEELVALPTNVHVCITSRPESDIASILQPLASTSLALHAEDGQALDIKHYIESIIRSDIKFGCWREEVKLHAIETLVNKADGM